MSERQILDALRPERVRSYVEHLTREIPSRLAGSENGRRVADHNAAALREAGVPAAVQETMGLVSFPEAGSLAILGDGTAEVECFTCGHSPVTPPEGLEGELVHVGSCGVADLERIDVAGRIVLCETSYSPPRMEKQRLAALKGAIGAVMMNWGRADDRTLPFGSIKPAWGNPTPETARDEMPRIPAVGVSHAAGRRLRERCGAGPVRIRMHTRAENAWRPVQITTGEIEAAGSADFVLVGGHQDSWFGEGATDNAAGNGCIVELARVFAAHRDKLRRGIVFGFWTAHETGTMVGSSWFVDTNWQRLRRHAVAYLSIDQPASAGTTRWLTKSNVEMRAFHQRIERRLLDVPCDWKAQNKGGDASLFGLGVPMIYGMGAFDEETLRATADANLGWWHHSLACTIDKVDFGWMEPHLRVYAAWLWELCTAVILPYEFTAVAARLRERLDQLAADPALADLAFGELAREAADFASLAARLDEAAERWRAPSADPDGAEAAAAILNPALKALSNRLIPIQSTVKGVYGHDPYGYTPQLDPIPCLYETARYARLAPGEERWMLHTQLLRDRNRVADALDDACGTVRAALAGLTGR